VPHYRQLKSGEKQMIKVNCETSKGGSVEFNKSHGVSASYAVVSVGDIPPAEIFYAWLKLPNGKRLQLFVNRETGLVVVDVIDKNDKGGIEILRRNV
jgi:hypothetical protein